VRGSADLLRLVHAAGALNRQSAAEAVDSVANQLKLVFDVTEQPAVFGDLCGEILVFDSGDIERFARLDAPFTAPPIAVPAFYAHTAQRAHLARNRVR
jgi:hypothetical protein